MAKAVNAEFVEVIVGKIEPETAFEMFEAAFNLLSVESGDRCGHLV
jgi:hypothetical protein